MVVFLLLLILAVLVLGVGGIASLLLFVGFCVALAVTWTFFGSFAALVLAGIGFFLWIK